MFWVEASTKILVVVLILYAALQLMLTLNVVWRLSPAWTLFFALLAAGGLAGWRSPLRLLHGRP